MRLLLLLEWPQLENHQDKGPRLKEKELLHTVDFNYWFRFRFKYVQIAESKLASEHPSGNAPASYSSLPSCFLDIFSSKQICFCRCRSDNFVYFSNIKCLMIKIALFTIESSRNQCRSLFTYKFNKVFKCLLCVTLS